MNYIKKHLAYTFSVAVPCLFRLKQHIPIEDRKWWHGLETEPLGNIIRKCDKLTDDIQRLKPANWLAVKHSKHVNRFAANYYYLRSVSSNACHIFTEPMTCNCLCCIRFNHQKHSACILRRYIYVYKQLQSIIYIHIHAHPPLQFQEQLYHGSFPWEKQ